MTAPVPRRPIALSILAAVVVLLVAAHGTSRGQDAAARERLRFSVVRVVARIGEKTVRSTGVVVDGPRGRVLTPAHSVWGATSIKLATGLAVVHGRILARAACDDLAVVEMQPRLPGFTAIATDPGRDALAALRPLGPPRGALRTVTRVAVRGEPRPVVHVDPRLPPAREAVVLDGALRQADAGAPLLDGRARVVGIVRAGSTAAAEVPWSAVAARLGELRPGPGTVFAGWRRHYRCAPMLQAYARERYPGFRRADARLNRPVPAARLPGTGDLDAG